MKAGFVIMMLFITTLMQCGGKTVVAVPQADDEEGVVRNEEVMGTGTGRVTQGSWMDLFLGMEKDDEGNYYVPELDDKNVVRYEQEATWYNNDDDYPARYRCTLGLYIDKEFPTQEIFKQVATCIDTLLLGCFPDSYYKGLDDVAKSIRLSGDYNPLTSADVLHRFEMVFDRYTHTMEPIKPLSVYEEIFDARVCIVAHKIYDQGDWASYIIEFSYDYNGSNGCPSWADYVTFSKNTGQRLTTDDMIKQYGAKAVSKNLREAFLKAKEERNADLEVQNYSGVELIELADGCAIVKEGMMFYYRPYNIGCGAEGEYNLVLNLK
jgi:hypothetical protein